eukprot:TRINITY_DN2560_c0_g1_i5.p1 TRINITY_DN2560_c0_g1~~TRINITY_DN2560_c0_g1_i5.p1  ORF type:complete len:410 (-),score=104.86 TRINITY_DN2560_c0_g1_i5:84-1313(-)
MKQMIWDEELSIIAQRHADQCKFAHDCSDCRKTQRFGVGQNLYIYKQTLAPPETNWDKAVTDWYEEVTLFSNKHVEPFKFSSPTGHYTALVWADTDKVGCGATSFKNGRWFSTLYTCNYGPNGNFINGQMYKQGQACSACNKGEQCSLQFPGLCESPQINAPARNTTRTEEKPAIKPTKFPKKAIATPNKNRLPQITRKPTTTRKPVVTRKPEVARTTTRKTSTKRPINTTKRAKITTTTVRALSTSTRDLVESHASVNELFSCKFEKTDENCGMRNKGKPWDQKQRSNDQYQEVELFNKEKAEFFFTKLISPPASKVACLDFRYKKFSTAGEQHVLTVLAWPNRGKPGKVSIYQDSPDQFTWVRAQVTFKKVDRDFLLMFRAIGPQGEDGSLILALDDVKVTRGRCVQ